MLPGELKQLVLEMFRVGTEVGQQPLTEVRRANIVESYPVQDLSQEVGQSAVLASYPQDGIQFPVEPRHQSVGLGLVVSVPLRGTETGSL